VASQTLDSTGIKGHIYKRLWCYSRKPASKFFYFCDAQSSQFYTL